MQSANEKEQAKEPFGKTAGKQIRRLENIHLRIW
jgi:hypothetical protein